MVSQDEFGSYDPMLGAFTAMEYFGTMNNSVCVTRYDQVSFVEALSASLFNEYNSSVSYLSHRQARTQWYGTGQWFSRFTHCRDRRDTGGIPVSEERARDMV